MEGLAPEGDRATNYLGLSLFAGRTGPARAPRSPRPHCKYTDIWGVRGPGGRVWGAGHKSCWEGPSLTKHQEELGNQGRPV